jgi:hypothetical protein
MPFTNNLINDFYDFYDLNDFYGFNGFNDLPFTVYDLTLCLPHSSRYSPSL